MTFFYLSIGFELHSEKINALMRDILCLSEVLNTKLNAKNIF